MITVTLRCQIQLDMKTTEKEEIEQRIVDMNFVLSSLEYQPQITGWTTRKIHIPPEEMHQIRIIFSDGIHTRCYTLDKIPEDLNWSKIDMVYYGVYEVGEDGQWQLLEDFYALHEAEKYLEGL